jgi:hypothetical protein
MNQPANSSINYSYGPLAVVSTYNPIYGMYNPIFNHNCNDSII